MLFFRITTKNKSTMNKLSIVVILTLAVCSTYGISDRRSTRSASEVSAETGPVTADVVAPQDSAIAESTDIFAGNKTSFQ